MVDFSTKVNRQLFCAITFFGLVTSQLSPCKYNVVYLSDGKCEFICPVQADLINGYLLCKKDGHTVVYCPQDSVSEDKNAQGEECFVLKCEVIPKPPCQHTLNTSYKAARFVRTSSSNVTLGPIYVYPDTKPNVRPTNGDLPRITFEEPTSQMYMYGILSFFFGVIAFFIFALVFRFLYKRYQRHPIHVHTFSGHQLPLGSLQLRSFLSPSPYPPQVPFSPHNEQAGIPGLDLPPSYIVASELLDPPPSYEDISKPKRHSAQMKVTSL